MAVAAQRPPATLKNVLVLRLFPTFFIFRASE